MDVLKSDFKQLQAAVRQDIDDMTKDFQETKNSIDELKVLVISMTATMAKENSIGSGSQGNNGVRAEESCPCPKKLCRLKNLEGQVSTVQVI